MKCEECSSEKTVLMCQLSQWHDGEVVKSQMKETTSCLCGIKRNRIFSKSNIADYPASHLRLLYDMDVTPDNHLLHEFEEEERCAFQPSFNSWFTEWALRRLGIKEREPISA